MVPGATTDSAVAHVARAVCRRSERWIVTLSAREAVSPTILAYINRLADMLFIMAWCLEVRAVIRQAVAQTLAAYRVER